METINQEITVYSNFPPLLSLPEQQNQQKLPFGHEKKQEKIG